MEDFTKQDEAYRAYKQGFAAGVKSVTDNNVGDKMTPTDRERLYNLIHTFVFEGAEVSDMNLADHLIANGVTFDKDTNVLTNADRIRAMSDEELVKYFWEVMDDSKFCTGVCNEQRDCDVCRLAWLKQPSEVDNG